MIPYCSPFRPRSAPCRGASPLPLGAALPLALAAAICLSLGATAVRAQQPGQTPAAALGGSVAPAIAQRTGGLERQAGFVPLYVDGRQGRLLLELPRDSMRALFLVSQSTGLGSNPIGIDRGASAGTEVVRFDREGERVLVVFENWSYRSSAQDDPAHQRTVAEAFPPSTVAALPLLAAEGGRLLVDATELVMRDWTGVAEALQQAQQGSYAVARDRSSIYRPHTRAFPGNTEIDVALTFATSGRAGGIVSQVVPDGRAFTLRQHLTLAALPDAGYRPRALDPRVGYFGIQFRDYAQPVQRPLVQRWAARFRLERENPADPRSPIGNPILYYIDRGIPEPVRTATVQGAKWWEQAFDLAGLRGGFKVMDLPEGADPMDVRYNILTWENRHERGWSVGGTLMDPRTGEILKGMSRLDSHRARTDYNIYAGLMGADAAAADTAFVLARVRQVTAHEIGHTLGLAHNYIASTYDRGSVMDYPPPRVRLNARGEIDLSAAYAVGPGPYDVWAIRWGYGIFPAAAEQDSLRAIVDEGLRRGFLYLSDADARPDFASDPRTNLWDDAGGATEFLRHQMDVRRVALQRFGERNVRPGDPVALLQERLAPIYFFHRFAVNAVSKAIGGMEYANAVRGDGQQATRPVAAERQREALRALVAALQPRELAIPDSVLTLLVPNAAAVTPPVELFGSRTRPAFDELGAARTLAQMIVDAVLQRERAARLVQQSLRGGAAGTGAGTGARPLSLEETIDALVRGTWRAGEAAPPGAPAAKLAALGRVAERAVVDRLLALAADAEAAPEVRAMAELKLVELRQLARPRAEVGSAEARAHALATASDIGRWLERRELPRPTAALAPPPGDPFGAP